MHQSHIRGIILGQSPRTFGCFIRVICITLAHFTPWRHCLKKGLSSPSDAGNRLWCWANWLPPPRGMRKALEEETGGWKKTKKAWKKLTAATVLSCRGSWEYECQSLVCTWAGWVQCCNKLHQDWKDRVKAPTLELEEEEVEISTLPRQRAWEETREGKVLEVSLYVNTEKNKVVLFSLI